MIWLDQECLPQNRCEERELGIQAMDMVYQQALSTVGIVDGVFLLQSHLDAIASVLDWHMGKGSSPGVFRYPRPDFSLNEIAQSLLEFLEAFGTDPFNSRAWILQEIFSAGKRGLILMKQNISAQFRAPQKVIEVPQIIPGTFAMLVEDMQKLIRASREFLLSPAQIPTPTNAVAVYSGGYNSHQYARSVEVLNKVERFQPTTAAMGAPLGDIYVVGGNSYGPRRTASAAVALSLLRDRYNERPADRLAILANICDYSTRLDTIEIERRFSSLSTCVFTLALINGDLSLLCPEAYGVPHIIGEISARCATG